MGKQRISFNDFQASVGEKINQAKEALLIPGQRDSQGLIFTASRITKAATNLFFSLGNGVYEPVDALYQGFSERPGLNDVTNVHGIDVIDLTIGAAISSLIPFLAIERPMNNPVDMVFFQKLVAINAAGGFSAGNTIVNPFKPIGTQMDIALSGTLSALTADGTGANVALDFNVPIAKKSLVLKMKTTGAADATYEVIGLDKDGDGKALLLKGLVESVAIDYETGDVTLVAVPNGKTVKVEIFVERSVQGDAANTLRVKPETEQKMITTQPNRVIIENNLENQAYMNKMAHELQSAGIDMDFGQVAVRQTLEAYIQFINTRLVNRIMTTAAISAANNPSIDASSYYGSVGFTQYAPTKDDKVTKFFIELNTHLLKRCGRGITSYVTGPQGAVIMSNIKDQFVPNDGFHNNLDGVIGTFGGIPVVRHQAAAGSEASGIATFFGIHKTADGKLGPIVYGDFLPLYSTRPALNYDNPTQYAQALFSQDAVETIVPEFATFGTVKYANI